MMTKRVEFRPPDGTIPEGVQAGDEFDSVCTFRIKDSGDICLVMLGDQQMPGYESGNKSSRPAYQVPEMEGEQS